MSQFLFAATQVPDGIPYAILNHLPVRDGKVSRRPEWTRRLLSAVGKGAGFRGFVTQPTDIDDDRVALVTTSIAWPQLAAELPDHLARRTYFLLAPFHDSWGYWVFFVHCLPQIPELPDAAHAPDAGRTTFTPDLIHPHLTKMGGFTWDGTRLSTNPDHWPHNARLFLARRGSELAGVMTNLADAESRRIYRRMFEGTWEVYLQDYLDSVFSHVQYTDLVRLSPGSVVINGGMACGTELQYFLAMSGFNCTIHNYEPTGRRHLRADYAPIFERYGESLPLREKAIWNRTGTEEFPVVADGIPMEGMVLHNQKNKLPLHQVHIETFDCERIDDMVVAEGIERVDYIKLDLEGAEPEALEGMMETVVRFRPQLAVSIYHTLDHFIDLPRYLMERLENYNFYIRHYSYRTMECLLYAIPRERDANVAAAARA